MILSLIAFPAIAATVTFSSGVRAKTEASLGIPAGGVAPQGVKGYQSDRAAMKERARSTFEKNPVAVKVRGKAPEEAENEQSVRFKNGSIDFEISKAAGAEILMDLDRYTKRETPKRTVDEKTLDRYGKQYIRDQMPDVNQGQLRFTGVKKIMDSVAQVSNEGRITNQKSSVANYILMYQRTINNVPVVGPGEKIRVYLNSSGEAIGHSKVWRDLEGPRGNARPIVPPGRMRDAAGEKLKEHPSPKVEVDYFEFGYAGEGRYTKQDVLNPVYLIGYKAGPESKRVIKMYDAYTGAEIAPPPDPQGSDKKQ
jgi:hypothetical protein